MRDRIHLCCGYTFCVSFGTICFSQVSSIPTQKPLTTVVFAIVGNHEHDLPLEDVVANQPATYAGYVLVALHELELATQEPGGC